MNVIVNTIGDFLVNNKDSIIASVFAAIVFAAIVRIIIVIKNTPKNLHDLLTDIDYNSTNWRDEIDKALRIKETMKNKFPEYNDYLLIQYGSSVTPDTKLNSDYDFIVLMLGFPNNEVRYMHNKGTISDEANSSNKDQVDIVFRDYLSFLFAATVGMPYENSVITEGKLIKGHEGYFQWLQNITKNILFDRDFLIRRFNDKIAIEKQEFQKCLNEYEKYNHDKYYVIRSGYYYISSLLQISQIKKYEKVIVQNQIIELAKVRKFYDDFVNAETREKYEQLVENLKRNQNVDSISLEEIKNILDEIGGGNIR